MFSLEQVRISPISQGRPQTFILELGCGIGNLWTENLSEIGNDNDITISDLSLGMVEKAKQNLNKSNKKFKFSVIDAGKIPYQNNTFDSLIACHMLYHVPNLTECFSEIYRVLKPGG
ncbi:MAG: class I SAM-dependent methyltransferase, partial [Deltaproteobacteria bacterium]|nr:class I SAM-dependent methyltransferase [Deltaproteobacteria bacterium]